MSTSQSAKYEQLYTDVMTLLAQGAFRPGDRIGIKDLSLRLKVSPTPVREVLSRLAGRGVVDERRSEGFYLARFDARDAIDLYTLHGVCVLRALTLCTPGTLAALRFATAWELFGLVAQQSGDVAIAEVQAYLDDRLKVARRIEDRFIADGDTELDRLRRLVAMAGLRDLRVAIRQFHARRRALSNEIALELARRPRR